MKLSIHILVLVQMLSSLIWVSADQTKPWQLSEDARQISVRHGERLVLAYNKQAPPVPPGIDPIFERSGFLHPVASPLGRVVTAAYPVDHAHQNGIFAAWVKTKYDNQAVDFWNLAKGQGRVAHDRVERTFCGADKAGFVVQLLHQSTRGESVVDVLRETWTVTCRSSDGFHSFDIESEQRALKDLPLLVEEYHYGGMAVRGPVEWIVADKTDDKTAVNTDHFQFLNSRGSNRSVGNHQTANWVRMTGQQHGQPVSIALLSHRDNFRAPQAARIHPTKPYFCFAPCVQGQFEITKENALRASYRFVVTDHIPEPNWLDGQWRAWSKAVDVEAGLER